MKRVTWLVIPIALVALIATSALATAKPKNSKVKSKITGVAPYAKVKGQVFFEVKGNKGRRLRVHVERAKIVAGQTLDVYVGVDNVGPLFVKSAGEGKLDLWSRRGAAVPAEVSGDTLELRTVTTDTVATQDVVARAQF